MESNASRSGLQQQSPSPVPGTTNYLHPLANNQTLSVASSGGVESSDAGSNNTAMVTAELHLVALKDSFKQAANSLTQLYK